MGRDNFEVEAATHCKVYSLPSVCADDAAFCQITLSSCFTCLCVFRRQRFIVPALYGGESVKSDPLLEVHRSVDELRRSLSDVVSSISETQTLMRSQQRQLDDVVRTSSLHRVGTHRRLVMVALWNRADHYIFMLLFVLLLFLSFFSSPNLSRRRLDVCHTSTLFCVLCFQRAACSRFQTCILNSH